MIFIGGLIIWFLHVLLAYFVVSTFSLTAYIVVVSVVHVILIGCYYYIDRIYRNRHKANSQKIEWERSAISSMIDKLSMKAEDAMNVLDIPLDERQELMDNFRE